MLELEVEVEVEVANGDALPSECGLIMITNVITGA